MPYLGETVTEGTITKWLKAIGDQVARDEPLFEVSTDKVDSEVPAPVGGVVTQILVEEGNTVAVGALLAVISDDLSPNDAIHPGAFASSTPVLPPVVATPASTYVRSVDEAAVAPVPPHDATALNPKSGGRLVLSPVVRKLLTEHGIEPTTISGTGIGGRITRDDVEAVIATRQAILKPPPDLAATTLTSTGANSRREDFDEIVPFTNIRRRTAEHMVRSKATSAHTLMVKEADYERVEQVRRSHGDRFKSEEGFSLTYLPFAARATVEALGRFPYLNASVGEDALIVHRNVNLGIAVDLDNEGLIVPVVHAAEELTLRGMARRIRDLADRARRKRLAADEIAGGTFSITNAGPFGTLLTGAIINQPQVAILSTDGVSRKPVVAKLSDGSESIAIHSVGLIAVNFDHRAVDGAYVGRFLSFLVEILCDRDWTGEL